jgi:hypothetical protein
MSRSLGDNAAARDAAIEGRDDVLVEIVNASGDRIPLGFHAILALSEPTYSAPASILITVPAMPFRTVDLMLTQDTSEVMLRAFVEDRATKVRIPMFPAFTPVMVFARRYPCVSCRVEPSMDLGFEFFALDVSTNRLITRNFYLSGAFLIEVLA